jgi:hypothetical protein
MWRGPVAVSSAAPAKDDGGLGLKQHDHDAEQSESW